MSTNFDTNMQSNDAASSSDVSSPPASPQNNGYPDTIHVATQSSGGGVVNSTSANGTNHATNSNSNTTTTSTSKTNGATSEKIKKPRKKKDVVLGADGKPVPDDKPKKTRKPREPKDKAAGPNGTTAAAPRKKVVKTEPKADAPTQARQSTITEMVHGFQPPALPTPAAGQPHPQPQQQPSAQHQTSSDALRNSHTLPTSAPATPRPVTSGQNYDPIRGSTMDSRPANVTSIPYPAQTSPHIYRASASPSIASLIDPPALFKPSTQSMPSPRASAPHELMQQQASPPSTSHSALGSVSVPPPASALSPAPQGFPAAAFSTIDGAMDLDPTCERTKAPVPEIKAPSRSSSSAAPTPKVRPTPEPPKATGSGLLSSSDLFGGGSSSSDPAERRGVNIDLHIPLNPKGGNTINIAQEIIKKYGRDAINPRAAAHREQLLRIAAEQERLGGTSNDEMSVDLMSEPEGDSNVEMGGMDDEKSNTGLDADSKPPRKKRRTKLEEYDKEDDFIDDTEMAWQEQAAVAKDGFFVYSGPLIPEGAQPQVESTTTSKSTRGRGRGRGGKSAATGTTHASLAEKKTEAASSTSMPATTTRGRGSRGGRGSGAPRKTRITKAEKEKMDAEKADRERTGAHLTSSQASNGVVSASPAALPVTTHTPAPTATATPTGTLNPQVSASMQQTRPAQQYSTPPIAQE